MTSADTLSGHADLIDLLAAMFPLPGEFRIDPPSEADVAWLRDVVNGGAERKDSTRLSQPIKAFLRVSEDDSPDHAVELEVQLWLEQTRPIITVRRAEHLTRTEQRALEMELLTGEAEEAADVILAHVDRVRGFLLQHRTRADAARAAPLAIPEPAAPDERIWFWFPSLSTRAKRQDLVDYALRYGLTGFVLAGGLWGVLRAPICGVAERSVPQASPACCASRARPGASTSTCRP